MKHKSIDKIRVTEICKAADIERPTFYYHFKDKLGDNILDTQLAYSILFYCMGSVGMTQEWVLNDNITSAETVVQMMFQSIPENMRTILF